MGVLDEIDGRQIWPRREASCRVLGPVHGEQIEESFLFPFFHAKTSIFLGRSVNNSCLEILHLSNDELVACSSVRYHLSTI